jgi:hypothetical protein
MRHNNKGGTRGQLARSMPDRRHAARVRPLDSVRVGQWGSPCGGLLADRRALPGGATKRRINVTPGRLPRPGGRSREAAAPSGPTLDLDAGPARQRDNRLMVHQPKQLPGWRFEFSSLAGTALTRLSSSAEQVGAQR